MKNQAKKVTKVNQVNKVQKEVRTPQVSKAIQLKENKIFAFDNLPEAEKTSYKRLLQTSRLTTISNMGLNKALKEFLSNGEELTDKQKELLTFNNVVEYVQNSRFSELRLFTPHQITLLCVDYLKSVDNNIKREIRLQRQNKAIAKK